MDYPQTNTSAPLYSEFSAVSPRKVPTDDSDKVKDSSAPVRSTVTLAPPIKIEFGVNRVWVSGGGKTSKPFSDGENPPKDPEGVADDFHYAPSKEEDQLKVHFEAHAKKADHIKGLKLEIYTRGIRGPIHRKVWTGTELESLLGEATEGVYTKELAWSDLGLADTEHTPGGFLTLAGAPYQLRMTVTGKDEPFADQTPVGATGRQRSNAVTTRPDLSGDSEGIDTFAYPMTAWTWVHVLSKEVKVTWGEEAWISRERIDLDPDYLERVVGKEGESDGFERTAFKAIKEATEEPTAETWHEVVLDSNLFARKYTVDGKEVDEKDINTDYEQHEKLWGLGPRIPLTAEVKIQTIAGEAAEDVDARVFTGTRILWDWTDPEPDRWKKDLELTPDTQRFMDVVLNEAAELKPAGSSNCPVKFGGKLGPKAAPVFPTVPTGGDFPFKVQTGLKKRTWAALSEFGPHDGDHGGKTGVLFQPSRMAGDTYQVRAMVYFSDELDTDEAIQLPPEAQGSPGKFEVFRKITVHHVVLGDVPGIDLAACRDKATTIFRDQLRMHLDLQEKAVPKAEFVERLKEGVTEALKTDARAHKLLGQAELFMLNCLDLDTDSAVSPITFRDVDDVKEGAVAMVRDGTLLRFEFDKPKDMDWMGESIKGQQSGAHGYPILFANPLPNMLLMAEGSAEFRDGEVVTGHMSGEKRFLKILPGKCCTGTKFTAEDGDTEKFLTVKFPGGGECKLEFKRKTWGRSRKTDLSDSMKVALTEALVAAGDAFADSTQAFEITLVRTNDEGGKEREKNVQAFLQAELNKQEAIVDKEALYRCLRGGTGGHWAAGDPRGYAQQIQKDAPRGYVLTPGVEKLLENKGWTDPGVYVLHLSAYSNLADLPGAADVFYSEGVKRSKGLTAYRTTRTMGAFDPYKELAENDRRTGLITLVTADPTSDKTEEVETKPIPDVFAHEIAHALWLPHAPHVTGNNLGGVVGEVHVKGDTCLMNYDLDSTCLCGLCILRLRGWNWPELKNDAGELEYRVKIELDEVDELFQFDATTNAGKMARLQLLGLFNRPMGYESLGKDEAFEVCWEYAKGILDGLDGDPQGVLAEQIKSFIVDGGALPEDGRFARIRVPGGFTPSYSMSDLVHRYPDHHDDDLPNPEDPYALGAERAAYEDMLYANNAALGTIPLKVTVESRLHGGTWALAADQEVFVGLASPDTLPGFASNTSGEPLAGGKSFVIGAGAPRLNEKPKAFITGKVDGYNKSSSKDPQAGNAHHLMGGKRKLDDEDRVGLSGGVFATHRCDGFSSIPAEGQDLKQAVPHAVPLRTDEHGVAHLSFRPSRIGGDRYKLEAFVAKPKAGKIEKLGTATTGTMVRWRTIRICHYFKQDPPTAFSAAFETLADNAQLDGKTKDELLADLKAPIDEVDFSVYVNEELARSYCELILDPGAQTPKAIPSEAWTKFEEEVENEVTTYGKTINKVSLCHREKVRPFVTYYHTIEAKDDERKVFEGTLPTKTPGPDMVYVRLVGGKMRQAILHDHLEPTEEPASDGYNLKKLEQGDPVLGLPNYKKDDAALDVKGKVDYATGEVSVEFAEAQEKDIEVAFVADQYVDFKALYNHSATDLPGLFRLNMPEAYNQKVGAGFMEMETAGRPKQQVFLTDRIYCPSTWVFAGALFRALENNGQSYLPGLVIVQADHLDPYDALFARGQEGKGMGNGILLFRPHGGGINQLALHELGHGLFLQHAATASGSQPHLHDPDDGPDGNGASHCMMSYSAGRDGDHCGMCVANLRGLRVRQKPLRQPKVKGHTESITIELKDEEGLPIPDQSVEVLAGGDVVASGFTNELGLCRLDEVPKKVQVTFPGLDGREWDKA